jgi:cold shock protein
LDNIQPPEFNKVVEYKLNEENKMNGKVKFFDETKGFGFVVSDDGKEYFVHQSGLKEGVRLNDNDSVTFDVEDGDRGPKAVNVALSEE